MTERGSVRVARGRGGRARGGQASPSKSRTDRSLNGAAGFRPAECQPGQNVVDQTGANRWQSEPTGRHVYLSRRAEVGAAEVASHIEGLMKEPPQQPVMIA